MNASSIEEVLKKLGIKLNPGRGEKIAAAIGPLIETAAASNAKLDFDTDATTYQKALNK